MGPDSQKGEILSTWKEIAAYLNSGVRTCLRWEKESGLPVHRQEGAPRSRVFAIKSELDAWFKSRINNGTIHPESERAGKPFWKTPYALVLAIALVGIGTGLAILLRPRAYTPAKPGESGTPRSSGAFELSLADIVETEYAAAGRLRIWRRRNAAEPFEGWRIEPVRHTTFAIGNLDADPNIEVAAPGHCREYEKPGDLTTSKIRFFINTYKYGFRDWWKTTYFDPSQCVIEKDNYEFTETAIGDIDNVPGNEIVLLTAHALSVFRYDEKKDELLLISSRRSFIEGVNTLMRSAAIVDIDGDGRNEVLATAHEGEEGAETAGKGWLMVLRWKDGGPVVSRVVVLPGMTSIRGLKIGDIDSGGPKEAVLACYRVDRGLRYGLVTIWSYDKGFLFERLIDEVGEGLYGGLYIAAGDLSPDPGDEILVARNNPNEIISLFWRNGSLVQGPKIGIDEKARVNNVQIGRSVRPGFHGSVLVNGIGDWEGHAGKFFLQLINFGNGFVTEWVRAGGDKEDLRVSFAAFAPADAPLIQLFK